MRRISAAVFSLMIFIAPTQAQENDPTFAFCMMSQSERLRDLLKEYAVGPAVFASLMPKFNIDLQINCHRGSARGIQRDFDYLETQLKAVKAGASANQIAIQRDKNSPDAPQEDHPEPRAAPLY